MSEESKKEGIPIKDAVRLMHGINEDITYGKSTLNAQQIQELKQIDWKKVRSEYKDWIKYLGIYQSKLYILFLVFGISIILADNWLSHSTGFSSTWFQLVGIIIIIYSTAQSEGRSGHLDGYWGGYESGFEDGINKALGLSQDDLKDIKQRAIDMEIYGGIVNKWDKG